MQHKLNFSPYRKESLSGLKTTRMILEDEVKYINSRIEREEYSITIKRDDYNRLLHIKAEIEYLTRLIRFRYIWRPRDWWRSIKSIGPRIQRAIDDWQERRENKRLSRMSHEQQLAYYRGEVQKVERKLLSLVPDLQDDDCSYAPCEPIGDFVPKGSLDNVKNLLFRRQWILNKMLHLNPEEVSRIEKVNDQLQSLSEELVRNFIAIYRQEMEHPKTDYDIEFAAALTCSADELDNILLVTDADYYGSDIKKMLRLELLMNQEEGLEKLLSFQKFSGGDYSPDMTDEELRVINRCFLDDDWKDGNWHSVQEVAHIRFSHALHHLYDHMNLPMIDIMHLSSFRTEIIKTIQKWN